MYTVIGLMSGTSCDGVDAAIIKTDGENFIEQIGQHFLAYDSEFSKALIKLTSGQLDNIWNIEKHLTDLHARAVKEILAKYKMEAKNIDLLGFHGQAIHHKPNDGITVQIGKPALLAASTGIDVMADFRSNDVAHGGEGAPLVPIYLKAIAVKFREPIMFLNIGGVANICYVGREELIAFDTGPGNAQINDLAMRYYNVAYDDDGNYAKSGTTNVEVLNRLLDNDFFKRQFSKSLDRNNFSLSVYYGFPANDALATATEFTAKSIVLGFNSVPSDAKRLVIYGGGRHNSFLMDKLKSYLSGIEVCKSEDIGVNGDFLEAAAFAYLAVRCKLGLPISFPSTTKVRQPQSGGAFYRA